MTANDEGAVKALLDAGAAAVHEPEVLAPGAVGAYAAVLPEGYHIDVQRYDLRDQAARPAARTGTVEVHDIASFAAYWLRHRGPASEVYASVGPNRDAVINAVLDGHGPVDEAAGWGRHRITLPLTVHPEWAYWTGQDSKMLGQQYFAEHLDAGLAQIVAPPGSGMPPAADMLQVAQEIQIQGGHRFESVTRLDNGQVGLVYTEDRTAQSGTVPIPQEFMLQLRPWQASLIAVQVTARFRYRLTDGKIAMGYTLVDLDAHLEGAANLLIGELTEALRPDDTTEPPTIWRGTPRK